MGWLLVLFVLEGVIWLGFFTACGFLGLFFTRIVWMMVQAVKAEWEEDHKS